MRIARQKLARHWGRYVLSWTARADRRHAHPLTLMMPLAAKDIVRAAVSIPAIRRHVAHPIERVVVVAPLSDRVRALCRDLGVELIDETGPLTGLIGAERLRNLKGWYRQQLLKLAAPDILDAEDVLVFDSDTYPLRRTAFVDRHGRTILYRGDRNMAGFERFTEALIGTVPRRETSFVAHCMLIRRAHLGRLRAAIERHCGKPWIDAIFACLEKDPAEVGSMSEFDLLGHFLLRDMRREIKIRYYANGKVPMAEFAGERPLALANRRFRFVSCHQRSE